LVTRNCADFVRDAVNFYYPKAATRSFFADLDVATPKHVAKSVVSYAHHHPDVTFSAFVIPQIPGSIKRSTPVHGVVDSVFKAKKYEIPLLVFHPFVGGGFAVAYVVSGRFNPAQDAMMFSPDGVLELPLNSEQRRADSKALNELLRSEVQPPSGSKPAHSSAAEWRELKTRANFVRDEAGHPALSIALRGDSRTGIGTSPDPPQKTASTAFIGLTRDNILNSSASPTLIRDLMVTRLRQELRKGTSPHASQREFRADLDLLERLLSTENQTIAAAAVSVTGAER